MTNTKLFYALVGKKIREARENAKPNKLSQEDLATKVGLTRVSISNIENGKQKVPLHTLTEIAKHLGVSSCSLIPERSTTPSKDEILALASNNNRDWVKQIIEKGTFNWEDEYSEVVDEEGNKVSDEDNKWVLKTIEKYSKKRR